MLNPMKIDNFLQYINKYRKQLFSALSIALVFTPLVVTAGVYKWTDEDGTVHYGSQRPADAPAERLKIRESTTPYTDEAKAKAKGTKKEGATDKAKAEKKPEEAAAKAPEEPKLSRKEKKALCQQARAKVQTIESRGRVRVKDEAGNSRHLSDKERSRELAAARKNVSKHCK